MGGGSGEIAYAFMENSLAQIYLLNLAGGEPLQLTDMPDGACQPAWAPDGSKLAFISPCKGMDDKYFNSGLYLINADGTGLQQLPTVAGR